jgi:type I restriction enzyme S subunit
MSDQQNNVPELRFSEFKKQWLNERLSGVVSLVSGQHLSPDEYSCESGKIPYFTGPSDFTNGLDEVTKWVDESSKFAEQDDILITVKGSGVGELWYLLLPLVSMGRQLMSIQSTNSYSKFIYYLLSKRKNEFEALASGNLIPGLSRPDILDIKVYLPIFKEQQKIATFLSTVDQKITHLNKKHELLIRYKTGVMQQLFSQQIRFQRKGGLDFPDWEEKRLGDILVIGSGRDYKHLTSGNIPVYGTGGYMTSVNEHLYDGESVGIGRKGTIDNPIFLSGKFWTVDTLFYTHSFNNVLPRFVFALFQNINWQKHNEASGVPSLSKRTIEKIKVNLPSVSEQQKIADFLQSLDQKIKKIAEQIEQMDTFKQGLLQKMFI